MAVRDLNELNEQRHHEAEREMTGGYSGNDSCGCFVLASNEDGRPLRVIACAGGGWDHVSVSRSDRCPTWGEMDYVKRRFFREDETAMQLHVPATEHISGHPYCLHLWRPLGGHAIPRPPSIMVA